MRVRVRCESSSLLHGGLTTSSIASDVTYLKRCAEREENAVTIRFQGEMFVAVAFKLKWRTEAKNYGKF